MNVVWFIIYKYTVLNVKMVKIKIDFLHYGHDEPEVKVSLLLTIIHSKRYLFLDKSGGMVFLKRTSQDCISADGTILLERMLDIN